MDDALALPQLYLGFHQALHLATHLGQIRTLRNLYQTTRGEPARFHPENPTVPASPRARKRATAGGRGDRAIATRVRRLVAAWNRGDAHAFGDAFAPSATYVTGAGRTVRGRAAIADLVRQAPGRVRIRGEVEVRRRRGVVQARFGWRSPGPRGSVRSGVITCTLAREGTSWRIRRLTNEERPASPARPSKTG